MLNINAAPDWDNLKILSRNREDSRTYFIPGQTANIKAAARSEIDQNNIILLNGMWEFRYFRSVADVPDDFVTGTLGGKEEHVPSVWQAQGYEKWHYSNVNYPIPLDPPHVPNHNPCGVYKRKFVLPKSFYDKEIFISFLGVASAYHVYINGTLAGYDQVSHMTGEFDITGLSSVSWTMAFFVLAAYPWVRPMRRSLPSLFMVLTFFTFVPGNIFSTASFIMALLASGWTRKVYFFSPMASMDFSVTTGLRITS